MRFVGSIEFKFSKILQIQTFLPSEIYIKRCKETILYPIYLPNLVTDICFSINLSQALSNI